jgi:hypothetical protein
VSHDRGGFDDDNEAFQSLKMDLCRICGQQKFLETLCNITDPELDVEEKLKKTFNVRLAQEKILPQQM